MVSTNDLGGHHEGSQEEDAPAVRRRVQTANPFRVRRAWRLVGSHCAVPRHQRQCRAQVATPSWRRVARNGRSLICSCAPAAGGAPPRAGHPDRAAPRRHQRRSDLALGRSRAVRRVDARAAQVIRIDALWLATEPLEMRAGTETALARVVSLFGSAGPHPDYLFANRRANRMKVVAHDGTGVWSAARRLTSGKFVWPRDAASTAALSRAQFDALVLGLPWQRLGDGGVITVI